jgi:hypothetical protein
MRGDHRRFAVSPVASDRFLGATIVMDYLQGVAVWTSRAFTR